MKGDRGTLSEDGVSKSEKENSAGGWGKQETENANSSKPRRGGILDTEQKLELRGSWQWRQKEPHTAVCGFHAFID